MKVEDLLKFGLDREIVLFWDDGYKDNFIELKICEKTFKTKNLLVFCESENLVKPVLYKKNVFISSIPKFNSEETQKFFEEMEKFDRLWNIVRVLRKQIDNINERITRLEK